MSFSNAGLRDKLFLNKTEKIDEYYDYLGIRKDEYGALIKRYDYENLFSNYGWEAIYIKPISEGGTDDISNLRVLHWINNADRLNGKFDESSPSVRSGIENLNEDPMRNYTKLGNQTYKKLDD